MDKEFNKHITSVKDKVFRFARKLMNNSEDAQDVVQDLFEKLWKMKSKLSQYENLEAFTMKMTKNLCLDRLKHESRKIKNLNEIKKSHDTQVSNNYDKKDTSEIIKGLINELPYKQKMILHLRDVEGHEFKEIAEVLEIDINAVRMNLSRGRKAIKEKLIKTMNYGLQKS